MAFYRITATPASPMHLLALETSGNLASVCLMSAGAVIGEISQPAESTGPRTAAWLAPAIDMLLRQSEVRPDEIDLVAVPLGPGSFTGLRIGVTTAKVFAYAADCQIVGLNTLHALATQVIDPPPSSRLDVVMDAQRRELFVARLEPVSGRWTCPTVPQLITRRFWIQSLTANTLVHGPGLPRIGAELPPFVKVTPASTWRLQATTVAKLGWQQYCLGQRDDLWTLAPNYGRPSAAEEKGSTTDQSRG